MAPDGTRVSAWFATDQGPPGSAPESVIRYGLKHERGPDGYLPTTRRSRTGSSHFAALLLHRRHRPSRSQEEQNSMIRRYIAWRNRDTHEEGLRDISTSCKGRLTRMGL